MEPRIYSFVPRRLESPPKPEKSKGREVIFYFPPDFVNSANNERKEFADKLSSAVREEIEKLVDSLTRKPDSKDEKKVLEILAGVSALVQSYSGGGKANKHVATEIAKKDTSLKNIWEEIENKFRSLLQDYSFLKKKEKETLKYRVSDFVRFSRRVRKAEDELLYPFVFLDKSRDNEMKKKVCGAIGDGVEALRDFYTKYPPIRRQSKAPEVTLENLFRDFQNIYPILKAGCSSMKSIYGNIWSVWLTNIKKAMKSFAEIAGEDSLSALDIGRTSVADWSQALDAILRKLKAAYQEQKNEVFKSGEIQNIVRELRTVSGIFVKIASPEETKEKRILEMGDLDFIRYLKKEEKEIWKLAEDLPALKTIFEDNENLEWFFRHLRKGTSPRDPWVRLSRFSDRLKDIKAEKVLARLKRLEQIYSKRLELKHD